MRPEDRKDGWSSLGHWQGRPTVGGLAGWWEMRLVAREQAGCQRRRRKPVASGTTLSTGGYKMRIPKGKWQGETLRKGNDSGAGSGKRQTGG